jgi:error-prone DNA polymerase
VRSEPLVIAEGRMERYASAGGAINVVVRRLRPLEVPTGRLASVHELPAAVSREGGRDGGRSDVRSDGVRGDGVGGDERDGAVEEEAALAAAGASAGGAFRAVAPAVQSFARGRSR